MDSGVRSHASCVDEFPDVDLHKAVVAFGALIGRAFDSSPVRHCFPDVVDRAFQPRVRVDQGVLFRGGPQGVHERVDHAGELRVLRRPGPRTEPGQVHVEPVHDPLSTRRGTGPGVAGDRAAQLLGTVLVTVGRPDVDGRDLRLDAGVGGRDVGAAVGDAVRKRKLV